MRSPAAVTTLVLLVAGALYSAALGDELRYADERDYVTLAASLARHGTFALEAETPTAARPPGYPLVLAGLVRCGAGIPLLRFANFLALAGVVLVVHRLLVPRAGRRAAWVGALAVAVYPALFYTAGTLYPQTLATLLVTGTVALLHMPGGPTPARCACAGALSGCLVLTVPGCVGVLVATTAWLALGARRPRWAALFLLAAALPLAGWTGRNARVLGAPVFVSTNSGINLLLGNSEGATAGSGVNADIDEYRRQADGLGEVEQDRHFRAAALRWIADHPGRAAWLYLRKWLHHFAWADELATRSESSRLREIGLALTWLPLLSLALVRIARRHRAPFTALDAHVLAVWLVQSLVQATFFTRVRFRLPFDPLLVVLVAAWLGRARPTAAGSPTAPRAPTRRPEPSGAGS